MSSITGPGLFKGALLFEIAAGAASLPGIFLTPEKVLSTIVRNSAQITPAACTLLQWFGCITLGLNVPLVLSLYTPAPGPEGEKQVAFRKASYIFIGALDAALAVFAGLQYASGVDSGLDKGTALGIAGMFSSLVAMRAFFLFSKPEWLAGVETTKKTQ